ncbi:MAG: hypothetical protein ACYS7Y_20280 [Planctomycetota bacterium]|jgi:hypothetical protein
MLARKALVTHKDGTCLHNTKRPLSPPVEPGQLRAALAHQHTIRSFRMEGDVAHATVDYLPGEEPEEVVEESVE